MTDATQMKEQAQLCLNVVGAITDWVIALPEMPPSIEAAQSVGRMLAQVSNFLREIADPELFAARDQLDS